MTAPLTPSRLRALAEQCRDTGVVVEVETREGTLRFLPRRRDADEAACDRIFGCGPEDDQSESWRDYLYRYYDYNQSLLYIGITNDVWRRDDQHRKKSWRREQAQFIRVETFPTREACEMAEAWAIEDERPPCNVKRPFAWSLKTKSAHVKPYLDANGGLLAGRDVRWFCECGTPIDPPFEPAVSYRRREQ